MLVHVQAGLIISGINAEVMPGQWEFQIGPVGPLEVGDQVHLARYLLHRLGEDFQALASFNPKPMKGDWNGSFLFSLDGSIKSFRRASCDMLVTFLMACVFAGAIIHPISIVV